MHSGISDPLLKSRANAEIEVIKNKTKYADRTFGIPFIAEKITSSIVRRTFKTK
jgi:hypothetical protein